MSNKKKEFFLVRWFKRCFLGSRPELSTEEEEKIQTPMRAMVSNFAHRPLNNFYQVAKTFEELTALQK